MGIVSKCFAMAFAAATGTALVVLSRQAGGEIGLFFVAIVLGGTGGGFTLGLVGGERYGLKMPGKVGVDHKFDPGFWGDVFVGLMAGFLGVGVASRTLKTDLFTVSSAASTPTSAQLVELWFVNFSIAYVCGFLGLRLVKSLSERFLQQALLKDNLERVERNEEITAFLSAQAAVDMGQFSEAETLFERALALDTGSGVRPLIGLGRVYKRQRRFDDAIRVLTDAISRKEREHITERIAVAYWNRACYKVLAVADGSRKYEIASAFEDLEQSVNMKPSYRQDLSGETDLTSVRLDARFKALIKPLEADHLPTGERNDE